MPKGPYICMNHDDTNLKSRIRRRASGTRGSQRGGGSGADTGGGACARGRAASAPGAFCRGWCTRQLRVLSSQRNARLAASLHSPLAPPPFRVAGEEGGEGEEDDEATVSEETQSVRGSDSEATEDEAPRSRSVRKRPRKS